MINLVRAELRKLLSTQVWFWMLLLSIGLTALIIVVNLLQPNDIDVNDVKGLFTAGTTAYIAAFVLGVLGVTTEYRYQTITPTLLATPSRVRVIAAKLLTYVLVGVALAVACAITSTAIAVPWLAAKHVHYSFFGDGIAQRVLEVSSIVGLFALLGLGFGAAIRNQIVAVTVGVVYLLVVESLLAIIPKVDDVFPYLPGGASRAIIDPHDTVGSNGVKLLGAAAGYVLLIAWTALLSAVGAFYSLNRDIT